MRDRDVRCRRRLRLSMLVASVVVASLVLGGGKAVAQPMPLDERIKMCGACHGEGGNSGTAGTPSIAGQPEFFLINQLVAIREGVRPIEVMTPLVKDLKDSEVEALSKHFAALPAKLIGGVADAAKAMRGAVLALERRCGSCHLPTLAGQEQIPRLAGQRIDYLVAAMKAIRDNRRRGADSTMTAAVIGASDTDLEALAHYAATK